MKKKIPAFKSARAAAAFVDKADLSQYDLSGAQTVRFEMKRKDKSINLRLPEELYDAVRQRATHAGLPYQRFIRLALENAIATRGSRLLDGVRDVARPWRGSIRRWPSISACMM
jgi:predicted DNA binding CopG/RHH family protein